MAATNYKTPGTCGGGSGFPWFSPDNAKVSDNNYAYAMLLKTGVSDFLRATNFGFDAAAPDGVPVGATINGIEVKIEHHGDGTYIKDSTIILRKTSGQVGSNKASVVVWASGDEEITYPATGGATDKWGTTWTADEIRSNDFGVDLSALNTDAVYSQTAYANCISIRVYYTAGGTVYTRSTVAKTGTLLGKSRALTVARSKVALSGTLANKSRTLTLSRSKSALSGSKVNTACAKVFARTKAALIGTKANASRTTTLVRSKITLAGTKVNYSRAITFVRSKIALAGTKANYAKVLLLARSKIALSGTKVTASRTLTIVRSKLALAGTKAWVTRVIINAHTYIRSIVAASGTKVNYIKHLVIVRPKTAPTGAKVNYARALVIVRSKIMLAGTKVNYLRVVLAPIIATGEAVYNSFHSKIIAYALGKVKRLYSLGEISKKHTLDKG